jgi:hypothetical protein
MKNMKNIILKSSVTMMMIIGLAGCDFLDVIPNNLPALDHTFSNRAVTERFLFSCYAYLPDPTDPFYYPAYYSSKDEFDTGDSRMGSAPGPQISRGLQNSNSPLLDFWSGANGGKALFAAIRQCNIFLENAHLPRDMEESERSRWIAEVKFLKAYYHFFLVQLYGPIPIIRENLPLSASVEEVKVFREPVDECIEYIVDLLNEAVPDLPLIVPNSIEEDGRITQPIALSVKAKALVWAASPLFNGNQDYKNWEDSRGKKLISSDFDITKWERAATAIKNAIDNCHLAGNKLYEYDKRTSSYTLAMNDSVALTMNIRKVVTERWNQGVIWASTERMADGKGGQTAYYALGNMQRQLFPYMYAQDQTKAVSYAWASQSLGELFYTNGGVPIEEDKNWDYGNRFNLRVVKPEDNHHFYLPTGETSIELHFNREPRFYGTLSFDRGYCEIQTGTSNNGKSFEPFLKLRAMETTTGGNPGYIAKKLVAFETSCSRGALDQGYAGYDYRFPLIRLADLYLLYSEALNEVKSQPDEEVYQWIDEVRKTGGLHGVVASWQASSKYPDRPTDKSEMRKIIQKERMIELTFEGQRFWDLRRWKTAEQWWSLPVKQWNTSETTAAAYYVPREVSVRNFTFRDYLWPVRLSDIRTNPNLIQTFGW